jgi:chromosome segregation ATPase
MSIQANNLSYGQRIATAEEQWDTVPEPQFAATRTLRAALATAQHERDAAEREVATLKRQLALKDAAIESLRDCLGQSEAEGDELHGMLAEREGVGA